MKIFLLMLGCLGLAACVKSGYHIEDGHVVRYAGLGAGKRIVAGADPKHFKGLDDTYGRDRQHVFIRDGILAGADPGTFEILSWGYTRDKSHVWWDNRVVTTDAARFRIVPNPGDPTAIIYGRDSRHVYMREEKLEGADPETFEFVPMCNGYDLTRDKLYCPRLWILAAD